MKQFDLQDKNSQDHKDFFKIIKNHENDINNAQFRNLILEVLKNFGAQGIQELKNMFSKIQVVTPINQAILKIVGELTGLGEN